LVRPSDAGARCGHALVAGDGRSPNRFCRPDSLPANPASTANADAHVPIRRGGSFLWGVVDPRAARSTKGCEGREAAPPDEENAMPQYMLIMRGTDESNAAMMANVDELMAATRQFIEDTAKAGVYVAAEGLDDPGQGAVVHFGDEAPVVTDGPYGETKELFGGFFLLDVASKQEAVEWAKRVPAVPGSKIEIRRVPGEDEVPQESGRFVKEGASLESSGQV
jgi:hypothetical protein